jgi:hypothetical protein
MDFESGFGMGRQILSDIHQRRRDASASERDEASAELVREQARDLRLKSEAKEKAGGYRAEARSDKKLKKLAPKKERIKLKTDRAAAIQAKIKANLDKRVYEQYTPDDITSLKDANVQSTTAAAAQAQATADLKREEADTYRQRIAADQAVASTNAEAAATTANANFLQAKTKADEVKAARESSETTTEHLVNLDKEYNHIATMMANPPRLKNGKIDYGPAYDAWSNDISTAITRLSSSTSPSEEVNTRATTAAGFLQKAFDTSREGHQKEQGWINNQALKVSKGKQAANVQKYDQGERLERMRNLHGKQGEDDVHTRLEVLEMFRSKGVPLSYLRRDSKEFNSIFAFEQSEAMPFQILKDKDGGEYSSVDHPIMLIDRTATLSSAEAFANEWVARNTPPKAEVQTITGANQQSGQISLVPQQPSGPQVRTTRVGGNLQTTGTPIGSELYPHSKAVDVQSFLSGWESGQPLVGSSFLDGPTAPPTGDSEPMVEGSPTMPLLPQTPPPSPTLPKDQEQMADEQGINKSVVQKLNELGVDWANSTESPESLLMEKIDDKRKGLRTLDANEQQLKDALIGVGREPKLTPKQKAFFSKERKRLEGELNDLTKFYEKNVGSDSPPVDESGRDSRYKNPSYSDPVTKPSPDQSANELKIMQDNGVKWDGKEPPIDAIMRRYEELNKQMERSAYPEYDEIQKKRASLNTLITKHYLHTKGQGPALNPSKGKKNKSK